MEREPQNTEERLARLEGQYHALSKELTDNFKTVQDTLNKMQQQLQEVHTIKSGMLKSETLPDVPQRIDQQIDQMHKQIVAISNQLQIDQSKIK
jgi:septation ring formation regulator EzrA